MSTAARKRRVDAVGAPAAAVGSTRRRTSAGGSSSGAGAAAAGRGAAAAATKAARGRGAPIANRLPAPPAPAPPAASFGIAVGDAHVGAEGLDDAYDGAADGAEVGSVGLPLSYDDGAWAAEAHAAAPAAVLDGDVRIPAFLNKLYRCGAGAPTRGAHAGSGAAHRRPAVRCGWRLARSMVHENAFKQYLTWGRDDTTFIGTPAPRSLKVRRASRR